MHTQAQNEHLLNPPPLSPPYFFFLNAMVFVKSILFLLFPKSVNARVTSPLGSGHHLLVLEFVSLRFLLRFGRKVPREPQSRGGALVSGHVPNMTYADDTISQKKKKKNRE